MAQPEGKVKEVIVDSRINKVLSMRTDSITMLEALDSISEFYVANTMEARRALRQDVELQNINLAKKFIGEFDEVRNRIQAVEEYSSKLESACKQLAARVADADENMKAFMSKAAELESRRNGYILQSKEIGSFLSRFQLSDQEIEILHEIPIDSHKNARSFFSALQRLQVAHKDCKAILEKHCFSAGFELLDTLGQHQDLAYQRLFDWVKQQCENLQELQIDDDSDILLQIAIRHLRAVPAYFPQCQDFVVSSRRTYLVQKFVAALTQGGTDGQVWRAIDLHAHDAIRYVGDMLAWMHQAAASEEEFLQSVFGNPASSDDVDKTTPVEQQMGLTVPELLSRCLQGLGRPLRVRIMQTLESRAGLEVLYTLADLLTFYEATFSRMIPTENSVHSAIKGCLLESKRLFVSLMNKQAEAMTQSPASYPMDLTTSHLTRECCKQIHEVLRVHAEALSGMPNDDPSDSCHVDSVLGNIIQPLLQACRLTGQSLPPADMAIFMLNNVSTVQNELREVAKRFQPVRPSTLSAAPSSSINTPQKAMPTSRTVASPGGKDALDTVVYSLSGQSSSSPAQRWIEMLNLEVSSWVDVLVTQDSARTLHRSDMDKLVELIEVLPESLVASQQVGLGEDRVATVLRAFYSSLFTTIAPPFERLQDPELRELTRQRSAVAVAAAHELVHKLVSNPIHGYDPAVLAHSVEEVRVLLGSSQSSS